MLFTPEEVDDLDEAINLSLEELRLREMEGPSLPAPIHDFYERLIALQEKISIWRNSQVIPD